MIKISSCSIKNCILLNFIRLEHFYSTGWERNFYNKRRKPEKRHIYSSPYNTGLQKQGIYTQLKTHETQKKAENDFINEMYKLLRKKQDFIENVQYCETFVFDLITNNFDLEAELIRIKKNKKVKTKNRKDFLLKQICFCKEHY